MKQRIYLDTSVIGGIFDEKFEVNTNLLFNLVKLNQIIIVLSDLTENEIQRAPLRVNNFFYLKFTYYYNNFSSFSFYILFFFSIISSIHFYYLSS